MASKSIFKTLNIPPTKSCTGSVIFLHGSGGTGTISKQMIKFALEDDFKFPHVQIHYPTAPMQVYTLNGGFPQNVWFDRTELDLSSKEDIKNIDAMAKKLNQFISQDVESGIPINRIILGGFSMGGAMALHLGFRFRRDLAGIFCLSSFLSTESKVFEDIENASGNLPPLFMAHGDVDPLIPFRWGKSTYDTLSKHCTDATFHRLSAVAHDVSMEEMLLLQEWICKRIPYHSLD